MHYDYDPAPLYPPERPPYTPGPRQCKVTGKPIVFQKGDTVRRVGGKNFYNGHTFAVVKRVDTGGKFIAVEGDQDRFYDTDELIVTDAISYNEVIETQEKWEANRKAAAPDMINSPTHYNQYGIECIAAIRASMSPTEYQGYLKGNAMKYLWRYRYKGKALEDLKKNQWFLARLIESVEENPPT